MATLTFRVEGMHCASCGMLIDDTLEDLPGVRRSITSMKAGRTTVEIDTAVCRPTDVIASITEAGYQATLE
jgi:copper chaperone CopZ